MDAAALKNVGEDGGGEDGGNLKRLPMNWEQGPERGLPPDTILPRHLSRAPSVSTRGLFS